MNISDLTLRRLIAALTAGILILAATSCGSRQAQKPHKVSAKAAVAHPLHDTLRVATLYSPGSYFIYRDTKMGYDYDLVSRLASDKGMVLKLEVAPTMADAIALLDSGRVDLLATEVPVTAEYRARVLPCGPENVTTQVLVQPKVGRGGSGLITDVTQLAGKTVTVERDSRYYHRLVNLNNEIGGGIIIRQLDSDSIITEDFLELVSRDSIGLTIVDSDIAQLNKTYYPNLDASLEVSFPQRSKWAVAKNARWLADSIDAWLGQEAPRREHADIRRRYFEMSKAAPSFDISFASGHASPFDHIFKRYAPEVGWDWRLLAAIGYVESQFDASQTSWAGAVGLMQIMPSTGRAFGVSPDELRSNETSVAVAVKIIRELDRLFRPRVKDPRERLKFILAAYNAGQAHILDAMALARKQGLKDNVWDANVAEMVLLKSNPNYYNDPVVSSGYSRGRQTFEYVNQVMDFYNKCIKHIKK